MKFIYTKYFLKNLAERICDKEFDRNVKGDIEKAIQNKEHLEIPNDYNEKYQNETFRGVMLLDGKHVTTKYARSNGNMVFITIWPSKSWEKTAFRGEKK